MCGHIFIAQCITNYSEIEKTVTKKIYFFHFQVRTVASPGTSANNALFYNIDATKSRPNEIYEELELLVWVTINSN